MAQDLSDEVSCRKTREILAAGRNFDVKLYLASKFICTCSSCGRATFSKMKVAGSSPTKCLCNNSVQNDLSSCREYIIKSSSSRDTYYVGFGWLAIASQKIVKYQQAVYVHYIDGKT